MTRKYQTGDVCWVDLSAHDMATAAEFYGQLFGWSVATADAPDGPPYRQFLIEDQAIAGIGQLNDEMIQAGIPPMWNTYIATSQLEQTLEQVTAAGGSVAVPIVDAAPFGRLAFVADPTGGVVGLWEAGTHAGAGCRDQPRTVCWNELATRDLEQAAQFYQTVFGWDLRPYEESQSEYRIFSHSERDQGGLMQMTEEWGDMPSHWGVYFQVEDCEQSVAKLKTLGGSTIMDPFPIPVGLLGIAKDPQGAAFYLMQLNPGASDSACDDDSQSA